jgi:hypothetical protein
MQNFNINNDNIEELAKDNSIDLIEAIKELKDADNAFQKMVTTGRNNSYVYERYWQGFLQSIDRVWNKTVARCKNESGWQKLNSKYTHLRKKDQLLKYLVQARNVTEHTISDVITERDMDFNARLVQNGIKLEWQSWDRPLLSVKNKGTIFPPPKEHLGRPISEYNKKGVEEPILVATLAMEFYVEMINDVSNELFKTNT